MNIYSPCIHFCCSKDHCIKIMSQGLGEMVLEKYILCRYINMYMRANTPSYARKFVNKCVYAKKKKNRKGEKLHLNFPLFFW